MILPDMSFFLTGPMLNFIATLFGVISAFGLRWLGRRWTNHETRIRLKNDLRGELTKCKKRLEDESIKRIETQTLYVWQLAVHSGDARFLHPKERNKIAEKYFALNNYNYEAELVRAFGETYRQAIGMPDEEPKERLWIERSLKISETRIGLKDDIKNFIEDVSF